MRPDLDGDRPIFLQIREAIEGDILAGLLAPGDQIPSNSHLVGFFGVNPVTVHRGVSLLLEDGIVYKKRGIGLFVSPEAPETLRQRGRERFEQDFVEPLLRRADLLGIGHDALHARIDAAQANRATQDDRAAQDDRRDGT
jgi:DNA-binding transcriptional regulator YhcF (GntR family)